jgi:hypothetical protein
LRPVAQSKSEFKAAYPACAGIEPAVANVATQNGRRLKLHYLGTTKNDAWLHTRARRSTCAPCYAKA